MVNDKNLILFVHGLASTSSGAWGHFNDLIQRDPLLSGFDTSFFSYHTVLVRLPFGRRSARIQELARGLKTHVDNTCQSYTDITLVAHSMGGLIAKRYLLTEVLESRPLRIKRLMLYAVPNNGAELARAATFISWRHQQAAQLRPYSDIIDDITEQWARLSMSTRIRLKYVVGALDNVVDPHSAGGFPGNPDTEMLVDKDHCSIIRPHGQSDLCYIILRNFILQTVAAAHTPRSTIVHSPHGGTRFIHRPHSARVLFDTYAPDVEPWYISRANDDAIWSSSNMSVWATGPTGVGKTASLKRFLDLSHATYCYAILASHSKGKLIDILRYICSKLEEAISETNQQIGADLQASDLVARISAALSVLSTKGPFHLFLEEIPYISAAHFTKLVGTIYELIVTLDSAGLTHPARFFLSSIVDAKSHTKRAPEKIHEKVCFVPFSAWSDADCERLVNTIASSLEINLQDSARYAIIETCNGSPRFIKVLFRKLVGKYHPGLSVLELLPIVCDELSFGREPE